MDLMARERNPLVGTMASGAILSVRIVARGRDATEARELLKADVAEIRGRLGSVIFGQDEETLQEAVAHLLREQGRTVATAESCTGGLLGKRLTDVPGSSAYYLMGIVAYSDDAKSKLLGVPAAMIQKEGAVSKAVAEAMASGCGAAAGSDFALSITGIAGPGGGNSPEKPIGLVYIGLAAFDSVGVRRFLFGEHLSREEIRDRSCNTALNLLRLRLLGTDRNQ